MRGASHLSRVDNLALQGRYELPHVPEPEPHVPDPLPVRRLASGLLLREQTDLRPNMDVPPPLSLINKGLRDVWTPARREFANRHTATYGAALMSPRRRPGVARSPDPDAPGLRNPAVTLPSDENVVDWRPEVMAASALGDMLYSMQSSMRQERMTHERDAAAAHSVIAQMRAKQQRVHQRAEEEMARALKGESVRKQLQLALDAATQREQEAAKRELELERRLRVAEEQALRVEPLIEQIDQMRFATVAAGAEQERRNHDAELQRQTSLNSISDAMRTAKADAAFWRDTAQRVGGRGRSVVQHVSGARSAVEQMLERLATATSMEELGALNRSLFDAKAMLIAAEEELRGMDAPLPGPPVGRLAVRGAADRTAGAVKPRGGASRRSSAAR